MKLQVINLQGIYIIDVQFAFLMRLDMVTYISWHGRQISAILPINVSDFGLGIDLTILSPTRFILLSGGGGNVMILS